MRAGAINGYVDVAQLTLYAFWLFFAGLVYWLRREDKREGYPLEPDGSQVRVRGPIIGFPFLPPRKVYHQPGGHGTTVSPETVAPTQVIKAMPAGRFPGAPLIPTGNPMIDGVGPASWSERTDKPDHTIDGELRIQPMRNTEGYHFARVTTDPRNMIVVGADEAVAGVVRDVWIDEVETTIRYLEVELDAAVAADRHVVLIPEVFARYRRRQRQVKVRAILAAQFADVPVLKNPDEVTSLEEEKLVAYYGGGLLYATPQRQEPLL